MLVLTRKAGESVIIDAGEIIIRVMKIDTQGAGSVQIGISAPKTTKIYRREVWEKILRDRRKKGGIDELLAQNKKRKEGSTKKDDDLRPPRDR